MVKILAAPSPRARHHWTNWAGFLFFACLAGAVFRRSPTLAIMMLPVCLHDLVVGIAFLMRRPAKAHLEGWGPRIATYGATFLMPAFLAFAGSRYPAWVGVTPVAWAVKIGYCVWLVGVLLGTWTVWQLRYSFSLEPQARELVRTGPYRVARHPIYAAYVLHYLGMWVGHLTLPFGIALLAWLGLMAARVHFEEMVLQSAFPEYAEYRRQVGMFGPRVLPTATRTKYAARQKSKGTPTGSLLPSPRPSGGQIGGAR
jgi:protein-S-isoprenylcysteine O-methyltransferase Ste14